MVHIEADKFKIGGYKFLWEYDSGQGPGGENIIYVSTDKSRDLTLSRNFYFSDAYEKHIRNFCRKFALDSNYRRDCLEENQYWQHISRLYETNSHWFYRRYRLTSGSIFVCYNAADKIGKRKHNQLQEKFMSDCEDLYEFLKENISEIIEEPTYINATKQRKKKEREIEQWRDKIDPEIEEIISLLNSIDGVHTRFSCQGIEDCIKVKNRMVYIDNGHHEFAHVGFANPLPRDLCNCLIDNLSDVALIYPDKLEARNIEYNVPFRKALSGALREIPEFRE